MVIGIVLAYLAKTKNKRYNRLVYSGTLAGIFFSIVAAILFQMLAGGFEGKAEQLFEGITMLFGAFLLTTMIVWMMGQRHIALDLKKKVEHEIEHRHRFGLFFLVFISVLREGVETVIFLGAANFIEDGSGTLGSVLGIAAALFLGYLIFIASFKVNLKIFFNVSGILLLLFAAGLVAHGIHEFEEANILPVTVEHVWDLNPPAPFADKGIYPVFHEEGMLGGMAKGLFGYNGDPSLLEVISYFSYLAIAFFAYFRGSRTAPA